MENSQKRISWPIEFAIVLLAAFGWFIYASLHRYFFHRTGIVYANASRVHLILFEVLLLVLLGGFLYARGWTLDRIGFRPSWKDTAIGIALAVLLLFANEVIWFAVRELAPSLAGAIAVPRSGSLISPIAIVALAVINPVFEEVFAAGYLITVLKEKFGAALAVNAGATLRLLYHLYQGIGAVISILPLSFIFGIWYVRKQRLWPLIVAHAVLDFLAYRHHMAPLHL
jgi:CAAX amino terminal protease family.